MLRAIGTTLNTLGLARVRLEVDPLLETAAKKTGLTDFGDPGFLDGLQVLLGSAEQEARLHFIGRLSIRQTVIEGLVNRLLLTEAQKQTPELFARPLIPPLIILGLPRSGTTFLHRLLAEDPAHHAPRQWELSSPLPFPGRPDNRRKKAERSVKARKLLTNDLEQKHFIAVDSPEEDLFTLAATFEAWYFWMVAPVYGYLEWYLTQSHRRKYREYRAWLQVLQAAHPGRRLVLKAPEHTGALSMLLRAVPEARLVQLHRDPVAVFASFSSLGQTTQALSTNAFDRKRVAAANLRLLAEEARRNLAGRDANPDTVLDIQYDDLISDPKNTVRRVYEHYKLSFTGACQENMERYIKENPQDKHGVHRYSTKNFGFDDDTVRAHFTAYSERFGFAARREASS